MQRCAWPDCQLEGTFPAPKNPRDLGQRQYFCKAHIKDFNQRWNGLSGFGEQEIYDMQDGTSTWQRPTWQLGVNGSVGPGVGASAASRQRTFGSADDLYGFFQKRVQQEAKAAPQPTARPMARHLPADVQEACIIFSIEAPLPPEQLKKRYLSLSKQHHPDLNRSPQAAETMKRVNVAFRILSDYTARHP
jgi:hypothetical protein